MEKFKLQEMFGQPCRRIATDEVEAWITETGAHVGPVTFRLGDRNFSPMHVAPWAEETWAINNSGSEPCSMRVLRGDFFCMPFGGNRAPWNGEQYDLHGETANEVWMANEQTSFSLTLDLVTRTRPGRVQKQVELRPGHLAVYLRNTISGMSGPMTLGTHPMIRCRTPGQISVSPSCFGQVFPGAFEDPALGGYCSLKPGAVFGDLQCVPLLAGGSADISLFPQRRGFEDFVMMFNKPGSALGWSAVSFPGEGFVWFALKDCRVLTATALWMSNGGRHYSPWNGRHVNVLGVEEVTSSVATGLADSTGSNDASMAGCRTFLELDPQVPTVVNTIWGIAPIPAGFDRVAEICALPDGISLISESGPEAHALADIAHLQL